MINVTRRCCFITTSSSNWGFLWLRTLHTAHCTLQARWCLHSKGAAASESPGALGHIARPELSIHSLFWTNTVVALRPTPPSQDEAVSCVPCELASVGSTRVTWFSSEDDRKRLWQCRPAHSPHTLLLLRCCGALTDWLAGWLGEWALWLRQLRPVKQQQWQRSLLQSGAASAGLWSSPGDSRFGKSCRLPRRLCWMNLNEIVLFFVVSWQIAFLSATRQKWKPQLRTTTTTTHRSCRATPARTTPLAPGWHSSSTSCSSSVFSATGWSWSSSTSKPRSTKTHPEMGIVQSEEEDFRTLKRLLLTQRQLSWPTCWLAGWLSRRQRLLWKTPLAVLHNWEMRKWADEKYFSLITITL